MSDFHGGPQDPNQPYPQQPNQHYAQGGQVPPNPPQGQPYIAGPNTFQPIQPKPPKKHRTRNILLGVGAGLVVLIGAATAGGDPEAEAPVSVTSQATQPVDNGPTPDPITTPTNQPTTAKPTKEAHSIPPKPAKPTPPPKPALTASQEQAIGSAEGYLDYTAFSRKGLIKQLSSEYGEGFSVKDATFAVDYLKVNWNEQAAKKAKEYLETQHFSRKGLIQQLESAYGEQFTHSQAVYGVNKAGL